MFGKLIVNKSQYNEMVTELESLKQEVKEKDNIIDAQQNLITALQLEISQLTTVKESSDDVVLLTDVAEAPLQEEKPRRSRSRNRKSDGSKNRMVVRKRKEKE